MFVSYNHKFFITHTSNKDFVVPNQPTVFVEAKNSSDVLGTYIWKWRKDMESFAPQTKTQENLRIAVVCNWNDQCGISTYSRYLVDSMIPKVKELKVFSEHVLNQTSNDESYVERCWKRGQSLVELAKKIVAWKADFIIIQHEWGIFPSASHFMKFAELIDEIPYVVCVHSVFEHLDKIVYTSSMKNIIVHNEEGKEILRKAGNNNNIFFVPHGCVKLENIEPLWNIFQNPYTIMQFGFGFKYKGVERVIHAVHHLKKDPKFQDIFYFYLLSENDYNSHVNNAYYDKLRKLVEELGLTDNVAIVRKYQTEEMLNLYLRLAKIAVFPYIMTPNNTVYSASGAIRIAFANRTPVIASDSHLFDDLEGIVPRPIDHLDLAREIDEIFSNQQYRNGLVLKTDAFIEQNTWEKTADRYLEVYSKLLTSKI